MLLIDTAGRLHNKAELMAELAKVVRVIKKQDATAPHAVLLTLDATTGQNALNQVEVFRRPGGGDRLVMTKLDGTARGGILVAIAAKTGSRCISSASAKRSTTFSPSRLGTSRAPSPDPRDGPFRARAERTGAKGRSIRS